MKKRTYRSDGDKKSSLKRSAGWYWLSLFLISGWMFGLGIYVGRQSAPIKFEMQRMEQELAQSREAELRRIQEKYEKEAKALEDQTNLQYHDVLKDTRVEIPVVVPETPETAAKKTVRQPPASQPVSAAKQKPTAISDPSQGKKFTIQVAAFRDPKMADQCVKQLLDKGFDAYRSDGTVTAKGTWYRVRVGVFERKADTAEVLNRLKQDKYKPVLMNINQ